MRLILGYRRDGDQVAAEFLIGVHHVGKARRRGVVEHIGQQQCKRLVADDLARAPDSVAKAERGLLARKAGLAGGRLIALQVVEFGGLAAFGERALKLELAVEVIFDNALVSSGYKDEMFNSGGARLVNDMLKDRTVDNRQHFFRYGLGGREEACAEASNRKNSFSDWFDISAHDSLPAFLKPLATFV
jgi:hypothetical protein